MTDERMNELCALLDSGIVPDMARKYIAAGFKVFPLRTFYENSDGAGKRPATKNGFKDASSDAKTVGKWWRGEHSRDNIGIPTGEGNNLLVIDLDVHSGKDGAASLKRLEEQYGALPETRTVRTGSGGRHLWFRYPQGHDISCSAGKAGEGIDVRANGGYVVAPPSVHACGEQYVFLNDSGIATLPESWVKFLESLSITNESKKGGEPFTLPDVVPQGQRNDVLFRYACALWGRGAAVEDIRKSLDAANGRCNPPLSAAELSSIIRSMQRYPQGKTLPVYAYIPDSALILPTDFSDVGNARGLIATYGENLLFTGTRNSGGWYVWDGMRYARAWEKAQEFAQEWARQLLIYARQLITERTAANDKAGVAEAQALERHALKARSNVGVLSMLSQAASMVHVDEDDFDADRWILNTPSGIVDLRTGAITPHDRGKRCRSITHSDPNTYTEQDHLWSEFVDMVTCGDVEYAAYLQAVFGAAVIGAPLEEGFYIAYGGGANGKSTMINAICGALGEDYTGTMDADVLCVGYKDNRLAAMVSAVGKRIVVAPELEDERTLSTATVKKLSSNDSFKAHRLYADDFDVMPSHTLFLTANHLPKVNATDPASWRRMHVLPFDATMPSGGERIANYAVTLTEQAGGAVLRWLITGARQYVEAGCHLPDCAAVHDASQAWQEEQSPIADFVRLRIELTGDPADTVGGEEMYRAFTNFVANSHGTAVRREHFRPMLQAAGAGIRQTSRKVLYTGVKLKPLSD